MSILLTAMALAAGPRAVVPNDLFTLDTPASLTVSHDGTVVVYARSRWDQALDRTNIDLWRLDTRTREEVRLTFTDGSEQHPTLSPDGAWVYFLGSQGKKDQVWRMPAAGGAPTQLTRAEGGVADYHLAADGLSLTYAVEAEKSPTDPWAALRKKHTDPQYGEKSRKTHILHQLDLRSWRSSELHDPNAHLIAFSPSPDGRYVAMLTAPSDQLLTREGWSEVRLFDRTTGTTQTLEDRLWREEAPSPYGWLTGLAWADDSRAFAFRVDFDGFPGETFVSELAGGVPLTWKLPRPREVHPEDDLMAWVPGKRELCQVVTERGRAPIVCLDGLRGGEVGRDRTLPSGNVVTTQFAFSGDGRDVMLIAATPDRFAELYRLPARGNVAAVRLTDLNPHTADWALPTVSVFTWTAPDGRTVEGVLELPPGHDPTKGPIPTVIGLHGGPTAHEPFARRFRMTGETWLAADGFAVLWPNYRGSTGYGDAFLRDLVGHENDVEVKDILAGVDALVAAGIADPERLAVGGWSNGGYLTGCLISTTDRFKAASLGAGVVDMTLQWALEDTPGHVINFLEGQPWEQTHHYAEASPLLRAHQIKTPTILHVGADDPRVPAAHAQAMYRALHQYLQVPSELVVYPNTGHGPRTWKRVEAKMAWDRAWFRHYVLGEATPK